MTTDRTMWTADTPSRTCRVAWLAALALAAAPLAHGQTTDEQRLVRRLEGQLIDSAVLLDYAEQRLIYSHRLRPGGPAGGPKPIERDVLLLRHRAGLPGTPMLGTAAGWCLTLGNFPLPTYIRPGSGGADLLMESCMGGTAFRRVGAPGQDAEDDAWALLSQPATPGRNGVWVSTTAREGLDYRLSNGQIRRASRRLETLELCDGCDTLASGGRLVAEHHGLQITVSGERRLGEQVFDSRGRTLAGEAGDVWVEYDEKDRPLRLRHAARPPSGYKRGAPLAAESIETIAVFAYNDEGRLAEIDLTGFAPAGNITRPFRARTWSLRYDDRGRLVALKSSLESKPTEYGYDDAGRLADIRWSTDERHTLFFWGTTHEAAGLVDPSRCVQVYGKVADTQPDRHLVVVRKQCPGEKPTLTEVRVQGLRVERGDAR